MRDETHAAANTFYAYDPAGRLAVVRQALAGAPNGQIATSYGYDLHGNLTSVTDPNGNTTTYAYDDFVRHGLQTSAGVIDNDSRRVSVHAPETNASIRSTLFLPVRGS